MSVVNLRTGLMWKGRRKPVSLMIFYHNTWNPPVFRGSILFQEGLETDLMQQLLTPGWKQSSNLSQQPLCRKIGSRDPCMYKPLQPQSMNGAVNTQFCKEDIGSRGLEILPWTSHACDRYWRTNYGNRKWLTRETAAPRESYGMDWHFLLLGYFDLRWISKWSCNRCRFFTCVAGVSLLLMQLISE